MKNNIHDFFKDNEIDIYEPNSGHEVRFLNKLKHPKKKVISWKWMSIAASILLMLGFYLGSSHQKNQFDLKDVSPKMAETQSFFVNTINQELKEIERYRNLNTERIIEDALDKIEELEEHYQKIKKELKNPGNKRLKIKGLIENYQQRLQILENLLHQLNELEKPTDLKNFEDEVI